MIDRKADPVAWAMFAQELEDAAEALTLLLRRLETEEDYGEIELRLDLGHVYAHLNRAWHSRNLRGEEATAPNEEQFEAWSQFPADVDPVG